MFMTKVITRTCKYCNKSYKGTEQELLKYFVSSNTREGLTKLCKECKKEFYHSQKFLRGIGSRISVEELIEILDINGYPLSKSNLDKFVSDSYVSCDLSKAEWLEWIHKHFYKHDNIVQILNGDFKPCGTCKNFFPLSHFRNVHTKYGTYKDTYCPRCLKERRKHYKRSKPTKIDRERKRIASNKYRAKNLSKYNTLQKKHKIKKYLISQGYVVDARKIDLLYDIKNRDNIRYYKDLIDKYKDVVCLVKS